MRRKPRRPRTRRTRFRLALAALLLAACIAVTVVASILRPAVDSTAAVDGIVVVAGAEDDRYVYARDLAERGVAGEILLSRPAGLEAVWPSYARLVDQQCAAGSFRRRDGSAVTLTCFAPDPGTTEGEAETATRIARERGWRSLLVVTYWGHVSRVRLCFEQCFDGAVYVTDPPRRSVISRRYAVLHESGGLVKALIRPAC